MSSSCPRCGGHITIIAAGENTVTAACDRCEWAAGYPPELPKSPREQLTDRIAAFINSRRDTFNAPYGVLVDLKKLQRGAVRTITFGCARTLDATLFVWSSTHFTLESSAGSEQFTSEQAVYEWLSEFSRP